MEMGLSQTKIGKRTATIGCVRDISGRKAYAEALELRTLHDDVTGLPNRALFGDRVDRAIAIAARAGEPRAVLLVGLDDFRKVNETPGRERTDAIIQAAAARLQDTVGAPDTVARLSGNLFGILPSSAIDVETAAGIAWKVREAFERPFIIGDRFLRPAVERRTRPIPAAWPHHGRPLASGPSWHCARPSCPAVASRPSPRTMTIKPQAGSRS